MVKGENQIIGIVLGPLYSCVHTDKCNPKFIDACFCGAGDHSLTAVDEQHTVKPHPIFSSLFFLKSLRPASNSLCGSCRPRTLSCFSLHSSQANTPELLNASRKPCCMGAGALTSCHDRRTWVPFSLFQKNKTTTKNSLLLALPENLQFHQEDENWTLPAVAGQVSAHGWASCSRVPSQFPVDHRDLLCCS